MINKFRITVLEGQTEAIRFMSSLDRTYGLTQSTDEECVIGKDDMVVMKNLSDSPARFKLKGHEHDRECGRTVFMPSRQQSFTLWQGREIELTLGPGESCPIRCERWKAPRGIGPELPA